MKHLFTFLFAMLTIATFAQNYSLFPADGDQALYQFQDSYGFTDECTNCVFGYQVNAKNTTTSDTVIYHSKIYRGATPLPNTQEYCVTIHDTSWLGIKTIIKTNGDYLFFNRNMDTILVRPYASVNEVWNAYDLGNGNYIEGRVVTINQQNFLGVQDEAKSIQFRAKDAQGTDIVHPFNLTILKVSKNNGTVQGLNFHDFPNDTSTFNLIGLNSLNTPFRNIGRDDIYNFNVGDKLHITGVDISFLSYFVETFQILTVIDKEINNDTIKLSYDREMIRIDKTPPGSEDTTYSRDTIFETLLPYSPSQSLDSLPYNYDLNYQAPLVELSLTDEKGVSYDNRIVKYFKRDRSYWVDTCVSEIIDAFSPPVFYIEGLGGTYYYNHAFGNDTYEKLLVYYEKGNQSWGDSLNLKSMMASSTRKIQSKQLAIKPNPVNDFVILDIGNDAIQNALVQIYDINGQLILSESIGYLNRNTRLEIADLVKGMYIVKVSNNMNSWIGKILK